MIVPKRQILEKTVTQLGNFFPNCCIPLKSEAPAPQPGNYSTYFYIFGSKVSVDSDTFGPEYHPV